MKIRKFNKNLTSLSEARGDGSIKNYYQPMKKFVLTTTSESSDHYIYFIEHPEKPTQEELEKFLVEQGSDVEDGYSYENVDMCVEIKDFKKI
jgi:hypothetical protein